MKANISYKANIGTVFINTANSNLNGAGSLGLLLTASSALGACGTKVTSVVIKAMGSTTLGMIRLFVSDGVNFFLLRETIVPENLQTGVVQTFSQSIPTSFTLQSGYSLYVSTQKAEDFNIIAYAQDGISCGC